MERSAVNWAGYVVADRPLGPQMNDELTRPQARAEYRRFIRDMPERVDQLRGLCRANGVGLDWTDEGIAAVERWLNDNVEGEDHKIPIEWVSVGWDIVAYLGGVLIRRFPSLRWDFHTGGKKAIGYQKPVITGFTKVTYPKTFYLDLEMIVFSTMLGAINGQPCYGRFAHFLHYYDKNV